MNEATVSQFLIIFTKTTLVSKGPPPFHEMVHSKDFLPHNFNKKLTLDGAKGDEKTSTSQIQKAIERFNRGTTILPCHPNQLIA